MTLTELYTSGLIFYFTVVLRRHIFIIVVLKYIFISLRDFDFMYVLLMDIC
jgi:hypothetical protein